jgi:hypothetical protein
MIRIRRIVVQADAPDASMSAFALHLTRLYRAEISLLHTAPRGARALFNDPAETDSASCAEEKPAEAPNRLPAFDHRPCRTLRCSGTIPKILETLRGAGADLFVQRANRPTLRIRPLFPDRTIRMIDEAPCPVLTWPAETAAPRMADPLQRGGRVLCLIPPTGNRGPALAAAASLARHAGSPLSLIAVAGRRDVRGRPANPGGLFSDEARSLYPEGKIRAALFEGDMPTLLEKIRSEAPHLLVVDLGIEEPARKPWERGLAEMLLTVFPLPLLSFGPSLRAASLIRRYRRIYGRLDAQELAAMDERHPEIVEEHLFSPRRAAGLSSLFLRHYSPDGLRRALGEYGILSALEERGFPDVQIGYRADDAFRYRLRISSRGDLLMETIVREGILEAPPQRPPVLRSRFFHVLLLDWLTLQNPRAPFPAGRSPLPGQQHPGLGIAREVLELLLLMAARTGKDGLALHPKYLHNAFFYAARCRCYNPVQEGRLTALRRDLEDVPIIDASWAEHHGCLVATGNRKPFRLALDWQVHALTGDLSSYLDSEDYLRAAWETAIASRYRISWDLYRRKIRK